MSKRKILYVDDDVNNLVTFTANFRREYEVFTTTCQNEAFRLIKDEGILVVIADYKMPKINGVLFLEQIRSVFPQTVRLMLTGHAGLEEVIDAINRGGVFRFFCKPFRKEDVAKGLDESFELVNTRDSLESKSEKLKKAYKELDRLVYAAAHDITSPLSNILGLIELARTEPEHGPEYLNMIEQMSWRIQSLSQNIINYHFNRREGLLMENIDVSALVKRVANDVKLNMSKMDIEVDVRIEALCTFKTDRIRLNTVLNNLFSNAIRYQDKSKSKHWIRVTGNVNDKQATIVVEDNGIGVSQDELSKVFDSYFRGENGKSDGTGMGLYIVKETMEVLGGAVSFSSEYGHGSTVTLSLPNRLVKTETLAAK